MFLFFLCLCFFLQLIPALIPPESNQFILPQGSSGFLEANKFNRVESCRKERQRNHSFQKLTDTFYTVTNDMDCLCLLRGQESAGIVTCNGASPPTYTVHKVTLIKTRSPLYEWIETWLNFTIQIQETFEVHYK